MTQIAASHEHVCKQPSKGYRLRDLLGLARQRRDLAKLDGNALKDIGVTHIEASREAARPFWDAPENWHKRLY